MRQDIAGYILAGGKSRRMEGKNKLFLTYQGKSFYEWLREGLHTLNQTYISIGGEEPCQQLDEHMITDRFQNIGPIGGVLSGLLSVSEEALLVVPCDMVPLPTVLIMQMVDCYQNVGQPIVLKVKGKVVPFPGIYTKAMIPVLREMVGQKMYRISAVWDRTSITYASMDIGALTLQNVNTKEQYENMKEKREFA